MYGSSIEFKVFVPTVFSWIKEPGNGFPALAERSNIRPFVVIAVRAAVSQIRKVVVTAMFKTSNVFNMK